MKQKLYKAPNVPYFGTVWFTVPHRKYRKQLQRGLNVNSVEYGYQKVDVQTVSGYVQYMYGFSRVELDIALRTARSCSPKGAWLLPNNKRRIKRDRAKNPDCTPQIKLQMLGNGQWKAVV